MGHTIVLVLETWAQEDQNLKVILSYTSTRRSAWATGESALRVRCQ